MLNLIVVFAGGLAVGWLISKLHTADFDKKYKKNLENWYLQFHGLNKKVMEVEIRKFKVSMENEINRAQQEIIEQAERSFAQQEEEEYYIDLTKKDDDDSTLH